MRICLRKDFRELAYMLLSSLLALFGVLAYFSEIRQFVLSSFGAYFLGFLDGVVATMIVLTIIFYLASKI